MIYTNVCRLGSKMGVRGYDENGKRIHQTVDYQPTLYLSSQDQSSPFKDIHGNPLEEIQPGTMWECKQFIDQWKEVDGFSLHGQDTWTTQFLSDLYAGHEKPNPPFSSLNVGYLDIETECEAGFPDVDNPVEKINAITLRTNKCTYVLGVGEWELQDNDRKYISLEFKEEEHLLKNFIQLWNTIDLDIVTGWHCTYFDIPYIIERITYLLGEEEAKKLSPWKKLWKKSKQDDYGNMRTAYVIYGIAILDYMELYKKYVFTPRESYKLDFIAEQEINHKKLDWSEKYSTMSEFYKNDFQMFIEYNVVDVDLIYMMEQKLRLLELHTNIAYTSLVNYEDVFSPVKTWDSIIYNHLREQNIIVPFKENAEKSSQYAGAYVKDPKPDMYDWVVSFDLNSMYPMTIVGTNISPDTIMSRDDMYTIKKNFPEKESAVNTLLDKMDGDRVTTSVKSLLDNGVPDDIRESLEDLNFGLAANGYMFNNDKQGFLPFLMDDMYNKRKEMKKNMIQEEKNLEEIKTEMKKRGLKDG